MVHLYSSVLSIHGIKVERDVLISCAGFLLVAVDVEVMGLVFLEI